MFHELGWNLIYEKCLNETLNQILNTINYPNTVLMAENYEIK